MKHKQPNKHETKSPTNRYFMDQKADLAPFRGWHDIRINHWSQ